jgi:hypothetical protein
LSVRFRAASSGALEQPSLVDGSRNEMGCIPATRLASLVDLHAFVKTQFMRALLPFTVLFPAKW